MDSLKKDLLREEAKEGCFVRFGTPTPGVDHSNHYKPNPYGDRTGPTLAELTEATHKAFGIKEKDDG